MEDLSPLSSVYEMHPLSSPKSRSFIARTVGRMHPGSLRGAIFTLFSTACGSACLALPYVLSSQGLILGLLLLLTCCLSGYIGIINLSAAAEHYKCFTYADLVERILGHKWRLLFENIMILFVFGALVLSQVIIGYFMPSILSSLNLSFAGDYERVVIMVAVNLGIMLPLGLRKTLTALRFVSLITPTVLIYICLILIAEIHLYADHNNYEEIKYFSPDLSLFPCFGYCLFAFTCHTNVSQIYHELSERSMVRLKKIAARVMISLLLAYTMLSIFGYLSLLKDTPIQIIMRKPSKDISNDYLMVVARIGMTLSLIIGVPINLPASRKCIFQCWLRVKGEPSDRMHWLVTIGLLESTLVVAIFYPNILTIFSILGGFCGGLIVMLIPGKKYAALFRVDISYGWKGWKTYVIIGIFSLLFTVGALGAILSVAGIA